MNLQVGFRVEGLGCKLLHDLDPPSGLRWVLLGFPRSSYSKSNDQGSKWALPYIGHRGLEFGGLGSGM